MKNKRLIFFSLVLILLSGVKPAHSQAPDGLALYQQWCSTCHGDRGQGLTDEWRAAWPEGKQNCWQSKCHAGNHPPDGFSFPKTVPAVIGQSALARFNSAQDLYVYIRTTMPYWNPTLLSDEEYLAITGFLVKSNYSEQGLSSTTVSLSQNLATVPLRPSIQPPDLSISKREASSSWPAWLLIILAVLPLALGLGLRMLSNRPNPDPKGF